MTSDFFDLTSLAGYLGITVDSARTYHTRSKAHRVAGNPRPGDLPEPDFRVGGHPAWNTETIERWATRRPGRGIGGGRPRKSASPLSR